MKYLYTLLVASLVFTSCDEDFFNTVVEVDPPEFTKKLVVGATFANNLPIQRIHINLNQAIIGEDTQDILRGLSATLSHNDNVYDFEHGSGLSALQKELSATAWVEGDTYTLKVKAEGLNETSASVVYPKSVELKSATFVKEGGVDPEGNVLTAIDIEFDDPAGEENAYRAEIYVQRSNSVLDPIQLIPELDPTQNRSAVNNSVIFDDTSFDGKRQKIRLLMDHKYFPNQTYYVNWITVPKEQVVFEKRLIKLMNINENPFSTPVAAYSNIKDGLGFFTIENRTYYKVQN